MDEKDLLNIKSQFDTQHKKSTMFLHIFLNNNNAHRKTI